ncbi:DUF4432 domain-containing protein [Dermabacter sp. HMSC06F07]|uniref:aldose 1-epimerase family protein n=1 Tax=Dermabacter TaxID=36739 RepID=UPI00035416D4|nr:MULTISPECIES: aldose 1-epimerase family protein [Dermabacter]EPH15162.1 hypothetical protein HMPREF1484_00789 [Dermabacter sp. HFH0086]MDU4924246.1 aldose 1-epimerase family protein [Dermabacter sp.]OFT47942.1 DUF4432 domain-containing protein [Dermabacter sp. HMSC06F07]
MTLTIPLSEAQFPQSPHTLCANESFTVEAFRYPNGIASITLRNSRGSLEILPFMGQIIWGAEFDGIDLTMTNMFEQPMPAREIVDTYGCFAFHSGLLANGCPSPEDDHPLHGEFPCLPMASARLDIDDDALSLVSVGEYVKGFGHHYRAEPRVTLRKDSAIFDIGMAVTNLSAYQPMPLQYMCHMNYAFVPEGQMSQNLPEGAFKLRSTVPAHVTPTPAWEAINASITRGDVDADSLHGAEAFDPEIVYFADDLAQYGERVYCELALPSGPRFATEFSSEEFSTATRWILHNPDQKVAAFVLPGTSRPEGFKAAQAQGTLIQLEAGQTREFCVRTGLLAENETLDEGELS